MRHRLDHVRPGDKHVRSLVDHQHKIRNRRRIYRPSRARPHDCRNLRHHSAINRIAQKNVRIPRQRHHAFLNPRPPRIVQPNHRSAHLRRQIHDLHDLARVRLRERSAKHRKILRKHIHQPALNAPVARDKSVPINLLLAHAKVVAAMRDQLVRLFKRPFIEQKIHSLARRHLALSVLALTPLRPAPILGQLIPFLQFRDFLFKIHAQDYSLWPPQPTRHFNPTIHCTTKHSTRPPLTRGSRKT